MKNFFRGGMISGILTCLFSGCTSSDEPVGAVRNFDPERYMGRWYEIARLPHYFERGMDFVQAEYSRNPDGSIRVVNRGIRQGKSRMIVGKAKLKNPRGNPPTGELRVSFFGPFYSDYRIIELAEDYHYAVVAGSGRNFLWILSRSPVLAPAQLQSILERLKESGFAVEKLEYPRQNPE